MILVAAAIALDLVLNVVRGIFIIDADAVMFVVMGVVVVVVVVSIVICPWSLPRGRGGVGLLLLLHAGEKKKKKPRLGSPVEEMINFGYGLITLAHSLNGSASRGPQVATLKGDARGKAD